MNTKVVQHPGDPSTEIEVTEIPQFAVGETKVITGNIDKGAPLSELRWAANSSVACFPGTRFVEFMGNQVFYSFAIPVGTELNVTLKPTGKKKQRINVYGYLNFDGSNVPPISRCISCEAGYPLYAGSTNLKAPGGIRKMYFGQAVRRSYTVLIAVSGAKDVLEGEYELSLELKAR